MLIGFLGKMVWQGAGQFKGNLLRACDLSWRCKRMSGMTSSCPRMVRTAPLLHEQAIAIDGFGGYGIAYDDILSGGIHTTNVTLNMYAAEGFDYVLSQMRRYYSLMEIQPSHLRLIEKPSDILFRSRQDICSQFQRGCHRESWIVGREVITRDLSMIL